MMNLEGEELFEEIGRFIVDRLSEPVEGEIRRMYLMISKAEWFLRLSSEQEETSKLPRIYSGFIDRVCME